MDVQFGSSGLEINIAERLELAHFQFREFYENSTIPGKTLKVAVAMTI